MTTTIFTARTVITMNPALPRADAVAVRDGRIVGVGGVDELAARGDHVLDETFADHVLTPGFVEAHCQVMSGGLWEHTYLGYFGRTDPTGRYWPGCT
ncbi:MAG: amidohydrolase, partial [Actinomycetota bacterium]